MASKQPTLVWTNSAQMMQPYLPLALALLGRDRWWAEMRPHIKWQRKKVMVLEILETVSSYGKRFWTHEHERCEIKPYCEVCLAYCRGRNLMVLTLSEFEELCSHEFKVTKEWWCCCTWRCCPRYFCLRHFSLIDFLLTSLRQHFSSGKDLVNQWPTH